MQHRAENAQRMPGYWAFFGGGIEKDETAEQAVKREAFEELNYTLVTPKFILKQLFTREDGESEKYVFMEEYDTNQTLILNEGKELGWFNLSEVNKLKIIDHDMKVIEYIKGQVWPTIT